MALELTPEIQNAASPLAGGDSAIPAAVLTPPIVAPQVPAIGAPQDQGGQNALGDYNKQGGISEGFASQFAKAADRLGIPSGPGGWAKSIIGASMDALANVGSIGKVPEGAGALYGVGKVLEAQRAQAANRQERQDKLQQQAFENNLKMSREQREQQAFQADNLIRHYQIQNMQRNFTNDERKGVVESGQHWQETREKAGDVPVPGLTRVTGEQAKDYITKNKIDSILGKDAQIVGWQDHIGADGLPSRDKDGNIIQEPLYTFMQPGGPRTLSDADAADGKKYAPQFGYSKDTTLTAEQFSNFVATVDRAKNAEIVGNKIQNELDLTKKQAEDLKTNENRKIADDAIAPYMAHPGVGMDPKKALEEISKEAVSVDENGRPTPTAVKAQDALDKLNRGYGSEIVSKYFSGQETERQKALEIADKAKAKMVEEASGDPEKSGQKYLDSIKDEMKGRIPLIQQIANGQMPLQSVQRILTKEPGIIEDVALYDRKFNGPKAKEFPGVVKDFEQGTVANGLTTGETALGHLRKMWENTTYSSVLNPGSEQALKRKADVNNVSTEIATFLALGRQPTKEAIQEVKAALLPGAAGAAEGNLRTGIEEEARLMKDRMAAYEKRWDNALPAPSWNNIVKRPDISDQAKANAEFLASSGKISAKRVAPLVSAPANSVQVQIPGQQPGRIPKTALDQFKKDHPNAIVIQ